jgi:hypothetical protein
MLTGMEITTAAQASVFTSASSGNIELPLAHLARGRFFLLPTYSHNARVGRAEAIERMPS